MEKEEFRRRGHELVDWMADFLETKESLPVTPDVNPGDILAQLPLLGPEKGESFERIFSDFEKIILPGMTHWQHPSFFGYFPANNSEPSILAEMLMATMGAQCMSWLTSPAAAELEERVCDWLKEAKGIDSSWKGCIHDTASTATLSALLTARERASNFRVNSSGFSGKESFRVYSSEHVHSSIDKAVKISGIGVENLVRIPVDESFAMIPEELEKAILRDKEKGYFPLMVISALGTTSSTAVDPIAEITEITKELGIWHHIDAAFAGTALLLDEFKPLMLGHEGADSYVFNPHKWMMTNFDCTIMYLKEPKALVKTFGLTPEYLKTQQDEQVNNYRDWGIPLGRRFRALKLWFVIRSYGLEGLRNKIQGHLDLAREAESWILAEPNMEILAPVNFNTICFRYVSFELSETSMNQINADWMSEVNSTRKVFFTHTKLDGKYVIRWVIGQTDLEKKTYPSSLGFIKAETLRDTQKTKLNMPRGYKKDPIFTPELMRVIKIFGLVSVLIVVGLSFFNTRRANNTGKDQAFRMSDSNRLYFLNVRALQYDREVRQDAGMNLYRHGKRMDDPDHPSLDLVLILNPQKDEAYTYIEPVNTDWPIRIRVVSNGKSQEFTLENGDKNVHQKHQQLLGSEIRKGSQFYIYEDVDWKPFWNTPGELEYLETLLDDYQELIN